MGKRGTTEEEEGQERETKKTEMAHEWKINVIEKRKTDTENGE